MSCLACFGGNRSPTGGDVLGEISRKASSYDGGKHRAPTGNIGAQHEPEWKALTAAQIKEFTQVLPGLWLGSVHAAADHARLKQLGITHICNLAGKDAYAEVTLFHEQIRNTKDPTFAYKDKEVKDLSSAKLTNVFAETTPFITKGVQSGGVLIHCMMGVSRSVSTCIAYLIDTKGMTYDNALSLVKSKRVAAIPNQGFVKELRAYEKAHRGRHAAKDSERAQHALHTLTDPSSYSGGPPRQI